jgi:hypothetical protein
VKKDALLGEIEELIRSAPAAERFQDHAPEILAWSGRAATIIDRWDRTKAFEVRNHIGLLQRPFTSTSVSGEHAAVLTILHEAAYDLRLETVGPVNVAVGTGGVFSYFDELRTIIGSASKDLLFVDRYLDSEFVARYLPQVKSGVRVRLLARDKITALVPAASLFAQQHPISIQVRSGDGFHDRYLVIDGVRCFQSGASFKDGAKTAPTTITQITDAASVVIDSYEAIWRSARVHL